MKKIKVIIIDDSILVQKTLTGILNSDPEILVVGVAENPLIARQIIKILDPDILILDIEMPEMDGLTFLEKVMHLHPLPVLICSSFTPHCKEVTIEAFELGAVDILPKPVLPQLQAEIIEKVKNASKAKVQQTANMPKVESPKLATKIKKKEMDQFVFAIGASTGGTEALKEIFQVLPKEMPPIIVTQHLPEGFATLFAQRINQVSALDISVAKEGEVLKPGHAYIAPSGKHLEIVQKQNQMLIKLDEREPNCGHTPCVDVMMKSVASTVKNNSIAVLLTGMGADGANGMLEVQRQGGITIAQDESSSVVWGMPRAAVELGAANYVLPLQKIPDMMLRCLK